MTAPQARVRRDGRSLSIPAAEVVPGDVLELEAGDLVPADVPEGLPAGAGAQASRGRDPRVGECHLYRRDGHADRRGDDRSRAVDGGDDLRRHGLGSFPKVETMPVYHRVVLLAVGAIPLLVLEAWKVMKHTRQRATRTVKRARR